MVHPLGSCIVRGVKMRDPNRIPEVLDLIEQLWEKYPDWRLGQLLVNVSDTNDVFYVEDDRVVKGLVNYLKLVEAHARTD